MFVNVLNVVILSKRNKKFCLQKQKLPRLAVMKLKKIFFSYFRKCYWHYRSFNHSFCLLTWINNLSYDASGEEGLNWSLSGRIIASINIGFLLGSGKMLITMLTASFDFGWWICHDYSLLWGIVAGVIFFIVILIRYEFDKVEEMEDARMMREDPNGYRILQEKRKQTRELEEINRKLKR